MVQDAIPINEILIWWEKIMVNDEYDEKFTEQRFLRIFLFNDSVIIGYVCMVHF